MCGIAGILPGSEQPCAAPLQRMLDALAHRGPDDQGTWEDPGGAVFLAHCRLAIIDLSPNGHQPMASRDGRYVIAYNGEAYNFRELRDELADGAVGWKSETDTEVLLEGFRRWGITETLKRTIGMFAMAVWDRQTRTLTLARDRFGEKPLYYGTVGDQFVFASELKALTALPGFKGSMDLDALRLYFRYGYIPAPYTIWASLRKLAPATTVRITSAGITQPVPYWNMADAITGPRAPDPAAPDRLDALLRKTVRRALVADVPTGVFLSGGIDSSLIAAVAQAESNSPIRTFTIGLHEDSHDESAHALRIAEHLGTLHTQLAAAPGHALELVQDLARVYDEPFADPSQIPTLLVARLARRHVKVVLGGDGGDELFGGYNRYTLGVSLHQRANTLPNGLKSALRGLVKATPSSVLEAGRVVVAPRTRRGQFATKARKLVGALDQDPYAAFTTVWPDSDNPAGRPPSHGLCHGHDDLALAEHMMAHDAAQYLTDDILVKVDRAAMSVGLEVRAPLLSHEVFEAAWALPIEQKIRNGQGKAILRDVLARYVPPTLFDRPKTGFDIPLAKWLRGALREWASGLLSQERLQRDGLLDAEPIQRAWNQHQSGRADRENELWTVLMFQAWLDQNRGLFAAPTSEVMAHP